MSRRTHYCFFFAATVMMVSAGFSTASTTVLFNDSVVEIENTLAAPNDLWVSPEDLTKITGLELKPEGACVGDICIPIKQDTDGDLFVTRDGSPWVNATGLAKIVRQSVVVDHDANVWSFGEIPNAHVASLSEGMAPDFAMKDRQGNTVKLSDYRGKKVIIMTWASW
jgi:hypothetical protein